MVVFLLAHLLRLRVRDQKLFLLDFNVDLTTQKNSISEQLLQSTVAPQQYASAAILTPVESFTSHPQTTPASYFQQEPQEISFNTSQELQSPQQQTAPNLTSVLSSFSNYLRIGGGNSQQPQNPQAETVAVPAPAGLDSFISQDHSNAPPVPLFDPTTNIGQPCEVSIPPPTTSGN